MTQIYEGMFLLENQVVREGWKEAKSYVTGMLEKHGGSVKTARRWGERRLAYPIGSNRRATFLLTYYELPPEAITAMRRDFDLSENVMRYISLCVDEVPEGEQALSDAELDSSYVAPEPLADDAPDPSDEAEQEDSPRGDRRGRPSDGDRKEGSTETKAEGATDGAEKPAETAEAATTEAPATEAPATEAPATEAPATEAPATETPATEATTPETTTPETTTPEKGEA
ncbi:MAG: 30S ribosomal protein S6 [bacterium]|nr:30S ribosomal protein S6 [bacterium]